MRFYFLITLFGMLSAHSAIAQRDSMRVAADSIYALPSIHIVAPRFRIPLEHAPQRVTVIGRDDVDASGSRHLGALLEKEGAAFIRRYGTGLASVSLRGAGASQTLILLDGVPFSDPQLGQVDLSLIPTDLIEQVAVIHGAGSSFYGSSGMGGTINIQTRDAQSMPFLQSSLTVGPYGEREGTVSMAAKRKKLAGRLHISHGLEKNDYPFLNVSLFPPQTVRREGADRTRTVVMGSLQWRGTSTNTTLSTWVNRSEQGLPGLSTAAVQNERQWDRHTRAWLVHTHSMRQSVLSLRSSVQLGSLRYNHPVIAIDQTSQTTSATIEAEWAASIEQDIDLTVGIESAYRQAIHPNLLAAAKDYQSSVFATGRLKTGRLSILPSVRADLVFPESGDHLFAMSPQLGLYLLPISHSTLRIKANAGRAFRTPTFNDRYWLPGGNPSLRSESGWTFEAGIFMASAEAPVTADGELTFFHHRFTDQITWLPSLEGYWAPENISKTQSEGIEASGNVDIALARRTKLAARILYTLTETADLSSPATASYKKPLRYVPRHQFKTTLSARQNWRRLETSFDIYMRRTGLRYITTDASQYVPGYTFAGFNARVLWRMPNTSIKTSVFVENILDSTYEVIKGYPMPPRLARIQISLQFHRSSSLD